MKETIKKFLSFIKKIDYKIYENDSYKDLSFLNFKLLDLLNEKQNYLFFPLFVFIYIFFLWFAIFIGKKIINFAIKVIKKLSFVKDFIVFFYKIDLIKKIKFLLYLIAIYYSVIAVIFFSNRTWVGKKIIKNITSLFFEN
jgi:hypothetical protein